jgi:hypothetical protein
VAPIAGSSDADVRRGGDGLRGRRVGDDVIGEDDGTAEGAREDTGRDDTARSGGMSGHRRGQ